MSECVRISCRFDCVTLFVFPSVKLREPFFETCCACLLVAEVYF